MCHTHNDHWSPFECLTKREVSRLVSSGTKQWKRWGGLEEWGPSGEWAKRHVTSYPSGRTRKDCGVNQYLGKVRYLVLYAPRTYTYCTIQSADCWLLTPLAPHEPRPSHLLSDYVDKLDREDSIPSIVLPLQAAELLATSPGLLERTSYLCHKNTRMAELLARLTSVSSHSHSSASCDEARGNQIKDLIAFLKHSNNTSAITSSSDYLLDVSGLSISNLWTLALFVIYGRIVGLIWSLPVQNLDPSQHSLAYLFVFHLHIQSIQRKTKNFLPAEILPGGRLWLDAVLFLQHFDPVQIRYAGLEWRQLIELVAQAAQVESKVRGLWFVWPAFADLRSHF